MLIGLTGPTDLRNLSRQAQAECFSKRVFYFSDLTDRWAAAMKLRHQGQDIHELKAQNNFYGIVCVRQQVEDIINEAEPRLYTDFMGTLLATTVFRQGLKLSTQVTEAVVADIKYPNWARWFRSFGSDRNNRRNRIVLLDRNPDLPFNVGAHPSESPANFTEIDPEYQVSLDHPEQLRELRKLSRIFYQE